MAQLLASMIAARAPRVGQGRRRPDHHDRGPAAAVRRTTSRDGLPAAKVAALDRAVRGSRGGTEIARIKIWHNDGDLLYVADPHTRSPARTGAGPLARAGRGARGRDRGRDHQQQPTSRTTRRCSSGTARCSRSTSRSCTAATREPAGVFELYLPYEPVQASIRADTTRAVALLFGGLVVLWLGLFRTVATASRRLREEADRNEHQALHDGLTGLANRALLDAELAAAVAEPGPLGGAGAARPGPVPRGQRHPRPRPRRRAGAARWPPGSTRAGRRRTTWWPGSAATSSPCCCADVDGVDVGDGARRGAARARCASRSRSAALDVALDARAGVSVHPADAADGPALLRHADVAAEHAKRTHAGRLRLRRGARRAQHRAAGSAGRPGPGAHRGRAGAALPAEVRPGRPGARRRGPGPLAAPAARPAAADDVRPGRRAHRAGPPAHRPGAGPGAGPGAALAGRGPLAAGRGQHLDPQPAAARLRREGADRPGHPRRARRRCSPWRSPRPRSWRTRSGPSRC